MIMVIMAPSAHIGIKFLHFLRILGHHFIEAAGEYGVLIVEELTH